MRALGSGEGRDDGCTGRGGGDLEGALQLANSFLHSSKADTNGMTVDKTLSVVCDGDG